MRLGMPWMQVVAFTNTSGRYILCQCGCCCCCCCCLSLSLSLSLSLFQRTVGCGGPSLRLWSIEHVAWSPGACFLFYSEKEMREVRNFGGVSFLSSVFFFRSLSVAWRDRVLTRNFVCKFPSVRRLRCTLSGCVSSFPFFLFFCICLVD